MGVVALAATPGRAAEARALVAAVGRGHRVVAWHDLQRSSGPSPDAIVAADVAVLHELGSSGIDLVVPVACRVASRPELDRAVAWGAAVAVPVAANLDGGSAGATTETTVRPEPPVSVGQETLAPETSVRATTVVAWSPHGLDVGSTPVLPLLTRQRLRVALDLPDPLVLAVQVVAGPTDRSTGLALASAAVVDDELVPLALALGTPSVVSAAAAAALGLTPGEQVVVRADDGAGAADHLARDLARDEERCAAVATAARRFAEEHLDHAAVASRIRRALGLEAIPSLVDRRLDELATPQGARVRARAHAALTLFTQEHPS
jgi:hypothetical protein